MPIVTDGPMLEPENKGIDQFHVGMGASLGATVSETLSDLPVAQLYRLNTPVNDTASVPSLPQSDPLGNAIPSDGPEIAEEVKPAVQRVDMIEAIDRVKKAGLAPHLTLPDQPDISPAQLDIMIQRARERREREVTMERGPQGFIPSTLQVGTSFLVGAIDPINLASAFVPVMGELRYGKMLAAAGEGLASRLSVRASVGAAEGAVGQALLEPLDWWSHTQDGRDFGMSDVLHNVMFGAVLGGALHGTGGAVSDAWRRRAGKPVYPFGPGEIMDGMQGGTHLPSRVLSDDGITPEALEQHFTGDAPNPRIVDQTPEANTPIFHEAPDQPVTPAMLSDEVAAARPAEPSAPIQIIDDLPPRAREDAMRAGIASLIDGEPLRVGEMLEAAAKTDPRIAESFEAWHGSPHDFDRFDTSLIGTGEGKQSYGHGLYFAERKDVALSYGDNLDRDIGYLSEADEALRWLKMAGDDKAKAVELYRANAQQYGERPDPAVLEYLKPGNLYKVRIGVNRDQFLDWDKAFDSQTPYVQAALRKIGFDEVDRAGQPLGEYLKELGVRDQSRAQESTRVLQEAGIAGIRYLDRRWKGAGEHTPDFVVFDGKHIEITHKNGEPVKQDNLPPRLHAIGADARNWPALPAGAKIDGSGENGPVLKGLENRWSDALTWLRQAQTGDAVGVLEHPDVSGRVDVIWGDKRYGLAHIDAKHPGDADLLPTLWNDLKVERATAKYIELGSADAVAVIARDYEGGPKDWLLTFFQRRESARPEGETVRSPDGSGLAAQSPASPRGGNIGDMATPGNALDRDASWRALSQATPEFDSPDVVAASKAADKVQTPKAGLSDRVTASEKADAYAKQMYDMFAHRIPEEDRQRLDDLIKRIDDDNEAREIAIVRGGSCLFGVA